MIKYKKYFYIALIMVIDLTYAVQSFYSFGSVLILLIGNALLFLTLFIENEENRNLLNLIVYLGQLMITYVSMRIISILIYQLFDNRAIGITLTMCI